MTGDGNYGNGKTCTGPAATIVGNNPIWSPKGQITECGMALNKSRDDSPLYPRRKQGRTTLHRLTTHMVAMPTPTLLSYPKLDLSRLSHTMATLAVAGQRQRHWHHRQHVASGCRGAEPGPPDPGHARQAAVNDGMP